MRPRFPSAPVIAAGLAAILLSGCAFFEGDDGAPATPAPSQGILSRLAPSPQPMPAPASEPAVSQAKSPQAVPPAAAPAPVTPPTVAQAPAVRAPDTIMPGAQGQSSRPAATSNLPLDGHINAPVDPPDAQRLVAQADIEMEGKDGKGPTPENMASALSLFEQAISRGGLKAREALAVYYYYGRGTAKDPQRAADVVRPAAEAGLAMAALIYGQLHNTGTLPGGADEAQYWYNVARRAGCAPCISSHQEFLNGIEAKLGLPASKGQGDLISDPIVLQGVSDDAAGVKREYTVLGILYPGWKRVEQRLVTENGRRYDQLTLENTHQRRVRVYFDVTDWMKPAPKAPGAKS